MYRSPGVVALMPGTPCRCLREKLEDLKAAEGFGGSDSLATVKATLLQDMARCHNITLCSSLYSRVWAGQELLYSERTYVTLTRLGDALCMELKTDMGSQAYVTT